MTKTEAKAALNLNTDAALARVFGINRWAVGQWRDDEPIPELRELQLHIKFPEVFGPARIGKAA